MRANLNILIRHGRRRTGHHVLRLIGKVDHRLLLLLLMLLLLMVLLLLTCKHILLLNDSRRWIRSRRKSLCIGI